MTAGLAARPFSFADRPPLPGQFGPAAEGHYGLMNRRLVQVLSTSGGEGGATLVLGSKAVAAWTPGGGAAYPDED